jgi:hypothetical protein
VAVGLLDHAAAAGGSAGRSSPSAAFRRDSGSPGRRSTSGEIALARGDRESAIAHLGAARAEAVKVGLSPLIDRIDGPLGAS